MNWQLKRVKTSDLKEFPQNPRALTKKGLADLKKSITKFGLAEPLVCNTDLTICGGHGRLKVLQDLKIEEVGCYIPDRQLTDIEFKELNIRLNKNIAGEFDFDVLANFFELDNLKEWGFKEDELDMSLFIDNDKLDEVPEVKQEAISQTGDLFLLDNRHRVLCGDSTKKEDVDKLMNGQKADMVFTDPPYGMDLNTDWSGAKSNLDFVRKKHTISQGHKYNKIIGDAIDFNPAFIFDLFKCKEIFLWGADYYAERLQNKNNGSWFVWDKRLEESADKMYGSCFELCWSKNKHKREIARVKWAGIFGTEKELDKDRSRKHPTQKPYCLVFWFINKFSKVNFIIVDLFLGSGTTLIAAEQTNRICYGMEIDPIYIDVILKRYHNLFPNKEVKCLNRNFDFKKLFS